MSTELSEKLAQRNVGIQVVGKKGKVKCTQTECYRCSAKAFLRNAAQVKEAIGSHTAVDWDSFCWEVCEVNYFRV